MMQFQPSATAQDAFKTAQILNTHNPALAQALEARLNSRTKPLGSLGVLEKVALQAGLIQGRLNPALSQPHMVIFAGDHGAAKAGISAYPQAVTVQMVANFLAGGAAINVLSRQNGLGLSVVDAGLAGDVAPGAPSAGAHFIQAKVAYGTENYVQTPAMRLADCETALSRGFALVQDLAAQGCNAVGFGEMGIGNTASASLLTHFICQIPLEQLVGRGTGHDDAGLARKRHLLQQACERVKGETLDPVAVLAQFGGFEIAMMAGAYLAAAQAHMLIVVDGFIATSALLVAHALHPAVLDYCVFSHCSAEPGHQAQLRYLQASPLLSLGLRLGEGSGAALAFPLIQNALALMNEMAGFDSAGVSQAQPSV